MKPDNPDVNIGDASLYGPVGRIGQLYEELINHRQRRREGSAPDDPVPFSYSEFEFKALRTTAQQVELLSRS